MGKSSDQAPVAAAIDLTTRPPKNNDRTKRVPWEPRDADAYWERAREEFARHGSPSLRSFAVAVATAAAGTDKKRTHQEAALQAIGASSASCDV